MPSKWTAKRFAKIFAAIALVALLFTIFNTIFAAFLVVMLAGLGQINIAGGKLVVGGLFRCDHEFVPKAGLTVPQCRKCHAYLE